MNKYKTKNKKVEIHPLGCSLIIKAYEDGYSQVEIASLLNVSKSLISKIIR